MNGSSQGTEASLEDLSNQVRDSVNNWEFILTVIGILSILSSFVALLLAQNSFGLSKKHFYTHHANQIFNLITVLLSCCIIFSCLKCQSFRLYYQVEDYIRQWPITYAFYASFFLIFSTFLSWLSIKRDNLRAMRASSAFILLFVLSIGLMSFFISSDTALYTSKYDCYQAMASVNEQDFEAFNCKVKYIDIASSVEALFE